MDYNPKRFGQRYIDKVDVSLPVRCPCRNRFYKSAHSWSQHINTNKHRAWMYENYTTDDNEHQRPLHSPIDAEVSQKILKLKAELSQLENAYRRDTRWTIGRMTALKKELSDTYAKIKVQADNISVICGYLKYVEGELRCITVDQ
mgnify:CR=1 FL=1